MQYQNVCLEALGYTLPDEVVTSDVIEQRLQPLYERLRLPEGRLELMTGIRQRRFWPAEVLPSEKSIESGRYAIEAAQIDPSHIGALVHGSVCRDYLEPATASGVHHALGLPSDCIIYDVSNACLGMLNGLVQVANMIELGQIRAGLVVGTESGRHLVDHAIEQLNQDTSLTRDQVKLAVAPLTIGSGSAAILLVDRELSRSGNRIIAACGRANTRHNHLCRSGRDEAVADGMQPLMQTDSVTLMQEGIKTGKENFDAFLSQTGWQREKIDRAFCHQVGTAHRRLMFEALELDLAIDYPTLEWLGNTGSVALPMTLAIGAQQGCLSQGDLVALMGIGSGINALMIGVDWQTTCVAGTPLDATTLSLATPAPRMSTA